jgi:hypothetical protein
VNIDRTSGSSSGRGDPLNDALDALAPLIREKTCNKGPAASAERPRNRMEAAPPADAFRFAGARGTAGRRGPLPAADARSVMAVDDSIEKLRSLMDLLPGEHRVSRLPRVTPLQRIPGLRAASANIGAIRDRLAIHPTERWPATRRRPLRRSPAGMAMLGIAIALLCAGVVVTRPLPAMNAQQATGRAPDEAPPARPASLPQPGLPPAEVEGRAIPNTTDDARGARQDDKPAGSGAAAGSPPTSPASGSGAVVVRTSAIPGPGSVPETGAAVVLDGRDAKPNIEEDAQSAAASCYPSAAAVTHDHPDAWPSWTMHAPGHEGSRCWHAGTRAVAHSHRTESPTKRQRVGTVDNLGSPAKQPD